ncbi:MAG: fibrobacter succinogenes major paralogous domain-containing protein [Candidatus Symbiothrix sp.]|jgi:hypothetical protein|nr:fibrobacter succinogenes major paralogous domain-containing protein [Candidatus Symbiothrix sp.]
MKKFNFKRLRIKSAMTVALSITCLLATGNCSPVTAQVAIGSANDSITPGSLLDLSQATDAGGLLLPQIESADTLTDELRKPGMLVYNQTDGNVYFYNGTAWTSGGSAPSPSCSGTVTGVSGNVYPIGNYSNATNGLKYLCWTLTNLKEAGQYATNFSGQSEGRGYYYRWEANPDAINLCRNTLGANWRLPNSADWTLLKDGYTTLTETEKDAWQNSPASLAGYNYTLGVWKSWNEVGRWEIKSVNQNEDYAEITKTGVWSIGTHTMSNELITTMRCVRDLL